MSTSPRISVTAIPLPPRVRPRSRLRKLFRGAGIAMLTVIALIVLAVGFVHTPWGKSFVRGRVEALLAGKVNGQVRVGSLDYSFLFGEIRIGDVEIRDAGGRPAIGLHALTVDLDRGSLIAGSPVIDELAIDGLAVSVVKAADGTTNLTGLFKPATNDKPLDRIRVSRIAVSGAATILEPDGTSIAVTELALGGSLDARPATQEVELALSKIGAKVAIQMPDAPVHHVAVALESVSIARHADAADVSVRELTIGAVALRSLAAHASLAGNQLRGAQSVTVAGLRIDSKQLAELVGHEILIDDVAVDASVTGPEHHLVIAGAVRSHGASLTLDGEVDLGSPAHPSYRLSLVGSGLRSDLVKTPGELPLVETGLRVDLAGAGISPGDVDATLALEIGATKVGNLVLDGLSMKATAKRGAYALEYLDAHALGVELAGAGTLAADSTLHGRVTVSGALPRVTHALAAAGFAIPRHVQLPPRIDLAVVADGKLDGVLALQLAPTRIAMAGGEIAIAGKAQLDHQLLQTAATKIELRDLDLGALARLAGKEPKVLGSLHGTLALARTAAGQHVDYDLGVALRDPAITVAVTGTGDDTKLDAHVTAVRTLDHAVLATIAAQLPLATRDGKIVVAPNGPMHVGFDLARRPLAELVALVPEPLRRQLPAGDAEVHLALDGSAQRPTGSFTVALSAAGLPNIAQKVELHGELSSSDRGVALATRGTIWIDRTRDAIATLESTVSLPSLFTNGKLDPVALRAAATVDATLDIPDRALASLSFLQAKLAEVGGNVGGKITVRGPVALPALDATLAWHDYRTATGAAGNTTLHAHGTAAALVAELTHGGAVAITAAIDRGDNRVDIHAHAHADDTALLALVPAFIAGKLGTNDPGHLRWDMTGQVALVDGALAQASVTGSLEVAGGVIAIPHSDRHWDGIGLKVTSDAHGLRIDSLVAHEHDLQSADRTLAASGALAWDDNLHPKKLSLALAAHDWLLFGSPLLGMNDAPRAAADFDLGVDVDLASPIMAVDATVHSLALRSPDRFDRAHQPELASASGDIIYVDSKTRTGRLPVAIVQAVAAPQHVLPLDVRVHIPSAIHVNQAPLDLMARGELTVAVRDTGVTTRGTVEMDSGTLTLFGHDHRLITGSVTFSDAHPDGWLALTFEHRLPPAAMRDLSAASAGGGGRVTLEGAPAKPNVSLSGAANATFAEVMAMNTTGRTAYVSQPNMPASETVQGLRDDQLLVLAFMGSNLPHLMFLDRISAWADPYHAPDSYGHIENVEADSYSQDQKSRVRAVERPPTPGRSSAELQYDRLLINNDRAAFGVGLRAGSRGGGGVGMFVDWSSKD